MYICQLELCYSDILFCRVGASIPVIFSYFAEFQAQSRRGSMLAALAAFWTVGAILTSGSPDLNSPFEFLFFEVYLIDFKNIFDVKTCIHILICEWTKSFNGEPLSTLTHTHIIN